MSDDLFVQLLADLAGERAAVVIVTGEVGSGKSTLVRRAARGLRERGLSAGGIVAERRLAGHETIGYDVIDLTSEERRELARDEPPGTIVGRFFMRPEGLAFACRALEDAARAARVVFVDEIGPWELRGDGLADALRRLLAQPLILVLVVRAGLVEAVARAFRIRPRRVWEMETRRR